MTSRLANAWAPAVAAVAIIGMTSCGPEEVREPVRLFNSKDLTGWSVFVDPGAANYDPGSDPARVFRVEDGLIHVSGERFGYIATRRPYQNYRLSLEFRWGERKWKPRETAVRDSGVLVHFVGPDKIWPRSIECQIQEHDCGDFWIVDGASLVVGGKTLTGGTTRAVKTEDAERPTGEWNRVEVVCDGDSVTNIVNGRVVNTGTRARPAEGRILLQSEGAEVFYRNVELHPLRPRK